MNKETNIALLEKYLAGEVEASEVLSLDGDRLTADELQSAVEDYNEAILLIEGFALKEELKTIHKSQAVPKKKALPRWLAAASIILLGVVGTIVLQKSKSETEFSDYFDHFDQLVTYRDSDSTDYSAGLEAYTLRNYDTSYSLLAGLDSLNDEIKFYLGVSALASKRFREAVVVFEELGTEPSNKYYQQIRWYLGLGYWQLNELNKARATLGLIGSGEYKYEESRGLLGEI